MSAPAAGAVSIDTGLLRAAEAWAYEFVMRGSGPLEFKRLWGKVQSGIDAHAAQRYEAGKRDGLRQYGENLNRWANRAEAAEASLARLVDGITDALNFEMSESAEDRLTALLPAKADEPKCEACDGKGGWVTAEWVDPVSGPECEGERCDECEGTGNATPAPAMGEGLPPLPRAALVIGSDLNSLNLRFTADQMHAYGRACMALCQPSYDDYAATRLRIVAEKLGLGAAIPDDNHTLWGCAFAVLGQIRHAIDALRQPGAETVGQQWVLAKETVVEFPGSRPDLGYTLLSGVGVFPSFEEVSATIAEFKLPLGWVAMRLEQLLPGAMLSVHTPAAPVSQPAAQEVQPALTVWYGSMPESNGKSNFTAILTRKDAEGLEKFEGFTIARSEYPDRVRYEADCVRALIGELPDKPWITDYDADKHSGYTAPLSAPAGSEQEPQ